MSAAFDEEHRDYPICQHCGRGFATTKPRPNGKVLCKGCAVALGCLEEVKFPCVSECCRGKYPEPINPPIVIKDHWGQ